MYIFNSVIKKGFVIFRQSLLVFILDGILQIHIHMYVALAHSLLALSPKKKMFSLCFVHSKLVQPFIHSYIRRCILSSQSTIFPMHTCSASYWANTCNKCTTMAVNLQCGIISKMQTVYILSLILSLLHLWEGMVNGERVNCTAHTQSRLSVDTARSLDWYCYSIPCPDARPDCLKRKTMPCHAIQRTSMYGVIPHSHGCVAIA